MTNPLTKSYVNLIAFGSFGELAHSYDNLEQNIGILPVADIPPEQLHQTTYDGEEAGIAS